jgi:glycosyltransferase involved in cell wall biosynthesis
MTARDSVHPEPAISVIVPARNEQASLGACLESLVRQAGVDFEIVVVDDASTDRTAEIAGSFHQVRLLAAPPVPAGWTGKNNAVAAGARSTRGEWLLFTDADTIHAPGSLARALSEARGQKASLLSYSPEQEVHGFWEKAVMPVIFAELAASYQPAQVSDPASPAAAANGQYLLVSRAVYQAVGGHEAVAGDLLEDVALARAVKRAGHRIFFRFGGDAVRTRMYRSFAQLREGWTKNLVLLFPSASRLAALRIAEFLLLAGAFAFTLATWRRIPLTASLLALGTAVLYALFLRRIRKAHFAWDATLLAFFGLPVFSYLLFRSQLLYGRGRVMWKGRTYGVSTGHNSSGGHGGHARASKTFTPFSGG